MSIHNVGDIVATYNDAKKSSIVVGWITDVVKETIWFSHKESFVTRYRVEWCDNNSHFMLYSNNDIQLMKDLCIKWHNTKNEQ